MKVLEKAFIDMQTATVRLWSAYRHAVLPAEEHGERHLCEDYYVYNGFDQVDRQRHVLVFR